MSDIENVIIENLLLNEPFLKKVLPFLKKEYFTEKKNSEIFRSS